MRNNPTRLNIASAAGTFLTLLCCLGFGPVLAALSAIGLGFLINDLVLLPIMIVFLSTGAIGHQLSSRKSHGQKTPLYLHLGSAAVVVVFTFVVYFQPAIWLGVAGIFAASILDLRLRLKKVACSTDDRCHATAPSSKGQSS
ncbi:MAG: MerC domain-containing protein [Candidatus Hydrogenedentes bacterium]|nr:MerC domain-containing protein [Candidatus Hydrogenedentota bacterium]